MARAEELTPPAGWDHPLGVEQALERCANSRERAFFGEFLRTQLWFGHLGAALDASEAKEALEREAQATMMVQQRSARAHKAQEAALGTLDTLLAQERAAVRELEAAAADTARKLQMGRERLRALELARLNLD